MPNLILERISKSVYNNPNFGVLLWKRFPTYVLHLGVGSSLFLPEISSLTALKLEPSNFLLKDSDAVRRFRVLVEDRDA